MKKVYTANLIATKDDSILLVKRKIDNEEGGLWSLPGGTKKDNEKIKDTLIREIKEELGVDIKKPSLFRKYEVAFKDKVVIASYFKGDIAGEIKLETKELSDYKWFKLARIPKKLAYFQDRIIKDYLDTPV